MCPVNFVYVLLVHFVLWMDFAENVIQYFHQNTQVRYFPVLLTATTHHTHYKTPRSNSCFVEVCHIAKDSKSIFCLLLVIITLSLPYSFDRVLNDQEL